MLICIEFDVFLVEIVLVFSVVMKCVEVFEYYIIVWEVLSMWECMLFILLLFIIIEYMLFECLFMVEEGKVGVVVCFLVILELVKE